MKILALEFSADVRSAAVVTVEDSAVPVVRAEQVEGGSRRVQPFALIERTLQAAGLEREAIDRLAVGLGPGSYTGIRVAIAVVQGWQLARGTPIFGVSSVDTLAEQARLAGWHGRVQIIIDAQRREFYLAGFEISPDAVTEIEPLHLVSLKEVEARQSPNEFWIGPEADRWVSGGRVLAPSAGVLGQLAARQACPIAAEQLEPIYLREARFVKAPPPRHIP